MNPYLAIAELNECFRSTEFVFTDSYKFKEEPDFNRCLLKTILRHMNLALGICGCKLNTHIVDFPKLNSTKFEDREIMEDITAAFDNCYYGIEQAIEMGKTLEEVRLHLAKYVFEDIEQAMTKLYIAASAEEFSLAVNDLVNEENHFTLIRSIDK